MSAGVTARSTLAAVHADRVRALQHALYRAAKADPKRRFHALRDKVYREDVLQRAWVAVRRNNGAPGIDKITLADTEEYGVSRLLGELADELRAGTWRPLPARKVLIPKPGSSERRPLAIGTDDSYCPSCNRVPGSFGLVWMCAGQARFRGSVEVSVPGGTDSSGAVPFSGVHVRFVGVLDCGWLCS